MVEESSGNRNHPNSAGVDEDFWQYLRSTHPDLAVKFSSTGELSEILSVHEAYLAQRSKEKEPAFTTLGSQVSELLAAHWAIVAIFVLALFVRLLRVNFGYPYLHYYDETYIMRPALRMLQTGDFNPHFFRYPSLLIYLEFIVTVLFFLKGITTEALSSMNDICFLWDWSITTPELYLWGRSLIALLGAGTVVVVYMIGRNVFQHKNAGLTAALFLAVSPAFIHFSIPITVDVPTAFLVTASVYFSGRILREEKWGNYLAAGLLAGLAVSTKYNAFWAMLPYMISCTLSWGGKKNAVTKFLLGLASFPLGFLAGTPYAISEFSVVLRDIGFQAHLYGVRGHRGSTGEGNLLFFLKWILLEAFGTPLIPLAAIVGAVAGLVMRRKETVVVFSLPIIHCLHMMTQKVSFVRNMVVMLPFVAVFGGLAVLTAERLGEKSAIRRFVPALLVVLIAAWPAFKAIEEGWGIFSEKETRVVAAEWMKQNIPPGARVAVAAELHFQYSTLSGAPFEVVPVSQRNIDLPDLARHGIDFFLASQFKVDRIDPEPVADFEKPFGGLRPIQQFDGEFAYLEFPIRNPRLFIYKL